MKTIVKKELSEIAYYYANVIGYFRLGLLVLAGLAFSSLPYLGAALVFLSELLDYVDGPIARKYSQCSVYGHVLDWAADIGGQIVVYQWWGRLNPSMIPWLFLLILLEMLTMMIDTVLTVLNTLPHLHHARESVWMNAALKFSMKLEGRGYKNVSLGNYLMLNYALWSISACLSLADASGYSQLWGALYFINTPFSVMYVGMELSYLWLCLQQWSEHLTHNKNG
jgi:phosphatidylglycerophosphate synthase